MSQDAPEVMSHTLDGSTNITDVALVSFAQLYIV